LLRGKGRIRCWQVHQRVRRKKESCAIPFRGVKEKKERVPSLAKELILGADGGGKKGMGDNSRKKRD